MGWMSSDKASARQSATFFYQRKGVLRRLQGKDPGIDSGNNVMLHHDFGNFPKLRAIGAHEDKMVFLVLLFAARSYLCNLRVSFFTS